MWRQFCWLHHQIQFPPFYSRCQKVRSIKCQIRIYRFPKERLALETPDCKKTVQIDAHCTDLICNTDTLAHRRVAQLVGTWQLCWEDMEREAPLSNSLIIFLFLNSIYSICRKFWIKPGWKEALQVVPPWCIEIFSKSFNSSGILFSQLFVYVVCRAYIIAGNISAADTSANKNIGAGAVGSKIFEDCRKSLKLWGILVRRDGLLL